MIFTKHGVRFRVSSYGGLDLWLAEYDEWVRFGWDQFGLDPGEWSPFGPP